MNIQVSRLFGSGTKVKKMKDELGLVAKSFDGDISVTGQPLPTSLYF